MNSYTYIAIVIIHIYITHKNSNKFKFYTSQNAHAWQFESSYINFRNVGYADK